MDTIDQDALTAATDLVGRSGAREFELGHLHDDVPVEEAGWYAHAQFTGARITVENHRGPVEAAEALARRLLTGAKCAHCGGLVALSDDGAVAYPGQLISSTQLRGRIGDAQREHIDGPWDEAAIRSAGQCRWRRMGPKWIRGCEQVSPAKPRQAKRKKRRRKP